jgi:4-hydroxythreonine-4-phosphate dehydrogenase
MGRCETDAARAAASWIDAAVQSARTDGLQAIVTAPINKQGWMKAGLPYAGHTEMLAHLTGTPHVDMMLLAEGFRVVLATRHIPLRSVASALSVAGLRQTIETTTLSLDWLGEKKKRIAVCGLNPHAGDGGQIGDEEARIIAPAIQAAKRAGGRRTVIGPVPADTVFYQVRKGQYDAVIAMYHDQGLAPFKMVAFEKGVNLTLGLPIVRTSPDHGTAYAIAGKHCADPSSMIAALKLAAHLARRPNPWRQRAS